MNNTITNLIEALEKIQGFEDRRLSVLFLFLYAEHFSIELIKKGGIPNSNFYTCESCGNKTGPRPLTLDERIEKLIIAKILKSEDAPPFKLLNRVRNRLIHDLSPNNQEIEKWILEYSPAASTKALEDLLNNQNPWIKFYVCLVAAIANIYYILNPDGPVLDAIEKNHLTGKWIFHIKEKH